MVSGYFSTQFGIIQIAQNIVMPIVTGENNINSSKVGGGPRRARVVRVG